MVDIDAAHILHAGFHAFGCQIVGVGDLVIYVGGYGKLAGAIIRICGERIESGNAIGGYANDCGTGSLEFIFVLRERVRLTIAENVRPTNSFFTTIDSFEIELVRSISHADQSPSLSEPGGNCRAS